MSRSLGNLCLCVQLLKVGQVIYFGIVMCFVGVGLEGGLKGGVGLFLIGYFQNLAYFLQTAPPSCKVE